MRVRPPTSADVAAHAGLSRATVSQILNGRGDRFLPETHERVHSAAAALHYQPSRAGRSLVRGRDDTVVVLVPSTTFGGNLQDAVDQVTAELEPHGANVVVRFAGKTADLTLAAIRRMRPWAVINLGYLDAVDQNRLETDGIAVVPRRTAPARSTRHDPIAELQVGALTARGLRPIAFAGIADQRPSPWEPQRYEAIRAACAARDLPEPRRVSLPLELTGAKAVLEDLLGSSPIGLACYNDHVALAALAAARDLGAPVPDQLAVIGLDATALGQLWSPRLSTISFDIQGLMSAAVRSLLEIEGVSTSSALEGAASSPSNTAQLLRLVPGGTT